MKNLLSLIAAFVLVGTLSAQEIEAPKQGAKLHVESTSIELTQNGTTTFDVWVVRSKAARKAKFDAPKLATNLFEYSVEADAADKDHFIVTVNTGDLTAGDYSISLTGKSFSYHKVSGKVINFSVSGSEALVTKGGE